MIFAVGLVALPFLYLAFKLYVIYDIGKNGGAGAPIVDAIFGVPLLLTGEVGAIADGLKSPLAWWQLALFWVITVILILYLMSIVQEAGETQRR